MTNETGHYAKAVKWVELAEGSAEQQWDRLSAEEQLDYALRFAQTYAALSTAADIDGEAEAEARIAECVPEGGSRLQVAVPR